MTIYGTRPEAIKLAPLVLELRAHATLTPRVVVTAQHRSMLDQVNQVFGIAPDHDLNIIKPRQSLAEITTHAISGLQPIIEAEQPAAIVVQGDTTTTVAAALAGFYNQVPVVHLEAGLRTYDRYSPFPEEINRRLTSQLASLNLAPTATSRNNLLAEGIPSADIVTTGNTVIDALLWANARQLDYGDPELAGIDDDPRRVLLVTAHRRESWGEGMNSIGRALAAVARAEPGLLIVFPIHRNPVVREAIEPVVRGMDNVLLIEPLAYGSFARLMARATIVLTDSGGVQEEAPSLGKPVLVMRDNTERPEAVSAGTARLIGTEEKRIVAEVQNLLHNEAAYEAMANAVNPYGDGHAAPRSVAAIARMIYGGPPPDEFMPYTAPKHPH